ncbi:MAG: ferritin family protein [Candidatus Margulisbacteria bacterium]|nr:ferritin family protein [Candidatus Margulisiibacteriota bacterium]
MNNLIADTKLAIELEKNGYDFYSGSAAKTSNPLAQATLLSLADREAEHLAKITEFYKNLTGESKLKSDWLKGVAIPPKKEELLRPILLKLKNDLNMKFKTPSDINKAYVVAEGLERDSYNLYDTISKENSDETTKKFYAALAQEEREHYDILEDTLQYLNNPGDWFKKEERWIVEG